MINQHDKHVRNGLQMSLFLTYKKSQGDYFRFQDLKGPLEDELNKQQNKQL